MCEWKREKNMEQLKIRDEFRDRGMNDPSSIRKSWERPRYDLQIVLNVKRGDSSWVE